MKNNNFKSGCLICEQPVIIQKKESIHICSICNKSFNSSFVCSQGHYICDSCHTNTHEFVNLLINSNEVNPVKLFLQIENLESVHMHGPEHHSIVPCILLTTYKNCGGDINLLSAIETALIRSKQVPGGICGFWGTCGAAIGAGIYGSIVTNSSPMNKDSWHKSQKLVARVINRISQENALRCCKRTSRHAILESIIWTEEFLGIKLGKSNFSCTLSSNNKECIKGDCPFYEKNKDN